MLEFVTLTPLEAVNPANIEYLRWYGDAGMSDVPGLKAVQQIKPYEPGDVPVLFVTWREAPMASRSVYLTGDAAANVWRVLVGRIPPVDFPKVRRG